MKQNNTAVPEHSAHPGSQCRPQFLHRPAPQPARIPCGRVIDVGVVAVFPGLCICTVYEFFCSSNIGLRRVAVGVVFHDPLLGFIVKAAKDVRLFFTDFRIIFKACHNRTVIQHIQTQLTKTAPDVDLVCIVVAGGYTGRVQGGTHERSYRWDSPWAGRSGRGCSSRLPGR